MKTNLQPPIPHYADSTPRTKPINIGLKTSDGPTIAYAGVTDSHKQDLIYDVLCMINSHAQPLIKAFKQANIEVSMLAPVSFAPRKSVMIHDPKNPQFTIGNIINFLSYISNDVLSSSQFKSTLRKFTYGNEELKQVVKTLLALVDTLKKIKTDPDIAMTPRNASPALQSINLQSVSTAPITGATSILERRRLAQEGSRTASLQPKINTSSQSASSGAKRIDTNLPLSTNVRSANKDKLPLLSVENMQAPKSETRLIKGTVTKQPTLPQIKATGAKVQR